MNKIRDSSQFTLELLACAGLIGPDSTEENTIMTPRLVSAGTRAAKKLISRIGQPISIASVVYEGDDSRPYAWLAEGLTAAHTEMTHASPTASIDAAIRWRGRTRREIGRIKQREADTAARARLQRARHWRPRSHDAATPLERRFDHEQQQSSATGAQP